MIVLLDDVHQDDLLLPCFGLCEDLEDECDLGLSFRQHGVVVNNQRHRVTSSCITSVLGSNLKAVAMRGGTSLMKILRKTFLLQAGHDAFCTT